jgi:toxin ParE1/3/4
MQVRWSPEAVEDLERIGRRIEQDKPRAAREVVLKIYRGIADLETFPERGRAGKIERTRELVIPSLPYIVVYRLAKDRIEIVRIYHAAQDWP